MSESAGPDYVPFASAEEPEPERQRLTTRETRTGRLIAASAGLFVLLALAGLFMRFHVGVASWLVTCALVGGGCYLLAKGDRLWLAEQGFRPPARWLAVVPLAYLLVRSSRRFDQTHTGFAPFWAHLGLFLLGAYLIVWGPLGVLLLDRQSL